MLFLITMTWMFFARNSARRRVFVLASRPTMLTNSASWMFRSRSRRSSAIRFLTYLLMAMVMLFVLVVADLRSRIVNCRVRRERRARYAQTAIRTPGLIVALTAIPLMYCPRTAAGFRLMT